VPPVNGLDGDSVIVGQLIVMLYDCTPVQPFVSVASTVKLFVPNTVGVPDRTPDEDKLNPVGRLPVFTVNV
jgi:hypothetical protein